MNPYTERELALWSAALERLGACPEAMAWARTKPDYETAWTACERGDWMLCLIRRCKFGYADPAYLAVHSASSERYRAATGYGDAFAAAPNFTAADAVRMEALALMAEAVREHYPVAPPLPVEAPR